MYPHFGLGAAGLKPGSIFKKHHFRGAEAPHYPFGLQDTATVKLL